MSIDAALDMERQEVLALLENRPQPNSPERMRSSSPYTPRSPVRSMLDINEEPAPAAPASPTIRTTPTAQAPVRSMLTFDAPIPDRSKSRGSSPVSAYSTNKLIATSRSKSDASQHPVEFGPRASSSGGINDPTSSFQFDILPAPTAGQMPKRNSQGPWKGTSLGEALRDPEMSGIQLPGDRKRNRSVGSRLSGKSASPHGRLDRSRSPAPYAPNLPSGKAYLNDGQVLDISSAYRRLSDANIAMSGGSLSQLPRKQSDEQSGRLAKSYIGPDGEQLDSSEDEDEDYSTDDEERGRKKAPRSISGDAAEEKEKIDTGATSTKRATKSLLAAAEEERKTISAQTPYQYRSLLSEPEIKITTSSGDTVKSTKHAVHPHTSYDQNPNSATPSVMDSDEEADLDDIKKAQKLSFSMTNIISTPEAHRAIRIINRGAYTKIASQADERQRKYLVATDLSDESTHALEWAIGTVLRDGDTLIAIYCVDEETSISTDDAVPDEHKAMREQAAAINTMATSKSTPSMSHVHEFRRGSMFPSFRDSTGTPGSSPAPSPRGERSKHELERRRAVEDITNRVLRLLRKTQLQVRVIVEVLHCKNPKHLITEVIDLVDPTLVVIGSRGRSALKGVILGSFSNYLVTKSSVPVMVARKRLRKQGKYKRQAMMKQVNNLSNPSARSLVNAKID